MFLEFENIINARELGGLSASGGHVRRGKLLRTAGLGKATKSDVKRLSEEYAVRHVFDFRDGVEVRREHDADIPGAEHHCIPVLPVLPGRDSTWENTPPEAVLGMFREMYRTMAENDVCCAAYSRFLKTAAGSGETLLWHCTQGKDRTGIAAILLLTVLGVSEDDALEDYMLSNRPMAAEFERLTADMESEREREFYRLMVFVFPEIVGEYISCVRRGFGSLERYIRERLGLTSGEIDALRLAYLE